MVGQPGQIKGGVVGQQGVFPNELFEFFDMSGKGRFFRDHGWSNPREACRLGANMRRLAEGRIAPYFLAGGCVKANGGHFDDVAGAGIK